MWTSKAIALAAGMAAAMTGGVTRGAITVTDVTYEISIMDSSSGGYTKIPFPATNPSTATLSGANYTSSLSLMYHENPNVWIAGTMKLRADLSYWGPSAPQEWRMVKAFVWITFTTDEIITWTYSGSSPGPYGQYAYGNMQGEGGWGGETGGGTIGPGTHTFRAMSSVGGVPGMATNGYSSVSFVIPAPSAALTLLGVGFIASARRRRTE
jgi:hypothetical protein